MPTETTDERHDARVHLGERHVQSVVAASTRDGEQEREAPAERVRDHPGRYLEHDHARRERRVGDEHLEEAEPRVEQEERVDAPDERGRQRVQTREREVARKDAPARRRLRCGEVGHARSLW